MVIVTEGVSGGLLDLFEVINVFETFEGLSDENFAFLEFFSLCVDFFARSSHFFLLVSEAVFEGANCSFPCFCLVFEEGIHCSEAFDFCLEVFEAVVGSARDLVFAPEARDF